MEKNNKNCYCIILAGGVGRRLWPTSRKAFPKQFLDFFGVGRSLLQLTYDRFVRFIPKENIIVSTFWEYKQLVQEQLPELDETQILGEPVRLSTLPAVAWATFHVVQRNPEACFVVTPADQHILEQELFEKDVLDGLDFVQAHREFLAMGVRPTMPNTRYGYIQMGLPAQREGLYHVKSFSEKPELDFARLFVDSHEFLWNTGLFLWGPQATKVMLRNLPPMLLSRLAEDGLPLAPEEERELVQQYYPSNSNEAVDLKILEECEHAYVKECSFGWADIGCWSELLSESRRDVDGNACVGSQQVMFSGTRNTVVSLPEGMGAVIKGLDGYVVAQQGNMLVVCPNSDPAQVRQMADEAQMRLGDAYL